MKSHAHMAAHSPGWSLDLQNPYLIQAFQPLWGGFYEHYFRVQIEGWEQVPDSQVMFVDFLQWRNGCNSLITGSFFVDGVAAPVGRFSDFDVNPRNRSAKFGYTVNSKFRKQSIGTIASGN